MIPVFITTVAQRAEFLPVLIERAGGESCAFPVFDPEMKGVWFNTRRALERGIAYCSDHGMSHFATLQDDVWPVDEFQRHVSNAAAVVSDRVFGLFDPRWMQRTRQPSIYPQQRALNMGAHWLLDAYLTAQGYVWPATFAQEFLAWTATFSDLFDPNNWIWEGQLSREYRPQDQDDHVLTRYLTFIGRGYLATAPSLIQHLGNESTLRNRNTGKFLDSKIQAQVYSHELKRGHWNDLYYDHLHPTVRPRLYQLGVT